MTAAEALAIRAHGRARTPSGALLIDHVRRVASHFGPETEPDAVAAAWLHETVETGGLSFDDLRHAGVAEHVIERVDIADKLAGGRRFL